MITTRRLVFTIGALALALSARTLPALAGANEAPLRVGSSAGPYAEILDYAAKLAKAQLAGVNPDAVIVAAR